MYKCVRFKSRNSYAGCILARSCYYWPEPRRPFLAAAHGGVRHPFIARRIAPPVRASRSVRRKV